MKYQYLILVLLLYQYNGLDLCRQFTSHEKCIASQVSKCGWENTKKICLETHDYLQGCSYMLNKPACVRQLGNLFGELAKCRFHHFCETIPDLVIEKCSVNLSKSGCLAVQNPQEVCLWTNNTCVKIPDYELIKIQDNFVDTLYSASACSHITGYLTMHHTVLWQLTLNRPDLLTEADNLYRTELGLSVSYSESYDDPSQIIMQNNYIQSDNTFYWYIIRQSKSITLGNLKLNSRKREGCVALEIENDTDFIMLFSLTGQIYGVNHVYCQYLTQNPQNYINAVFGKGYCVAISETKLRDQNFIIEHQINCKSLTVTQCLQFESLTHNCQIIGEIYEYGCIDNIIDNKNINCLDKVCTNQQCKLNDGFYVDLYLYQCTNKCFLNSQTQEQCINITGCVWYNQHLDLITQNSMTYLTVCGPENGCDHIGLGKYYCQNLTAFCNWDQKTSRCHTIPQESLQYLKCHQANNVLVCSMIQLSDQQCIWLKDKLKCINVLDDPLLRLHGMYNTQSAVNMVLCNHYSSAPTKYEIPSRSCTIVQNSLSQKYVNRYNCLKVMSGYCHWNVLLQTCQCDLDFTKLLCQDLVEINEKVCQIAKLSNPANTCLFSLPKMSCFETSDYSSYGCENNGLSKEICVSLSKKGQYCQYEAGTCKLLTTTQISAILCTSLQYVNLETCIMHSAFEVGCYYDSTTQACTQPSKRLVYPCSAYHNQYACQFASSGYCYFDLVASRCLDSESLINTIQCENSNVNIQTCTKITTYSQNCYWNNESKRCFNYTYTSQFNNCDEYKDQTRAVCTALQTTLIRELMAENYCEFIDSQCKQSIEPISGCGETRSINVHRCSGQTDGNCVFINQTCSVLNENTRAGEIILTQIGCLQGNINSCRKVRQNEAFCFYTNTMNGMIIDKKCNEITTLNLQCSQINDYHPNGNSCALAIDFCFYDNDTCKSFTTKIDFNCFDIGISKSICLLRTIGRCVFQKQCQTLTIIEQSVECNVLNKNACFTYKFRKCYWDNNNNICNQVNLECELNSSFISSTYILNYSVCSLTVSGKCMGYKDKCSRPTTMAKMSCILPGLNEQACISIPDQLCYFRIGQCYESSYRTCEDMLFQQDCLTNKSPGQYCVYNKNKCYNVVSTLNACNAFSKTNYQYCQRYQECSYNFNTNECFHIIQNVQVIPLNNCDTKINQFDCSFTRNDLCYFDSICKPFTLTICPHLQYYASEKACKSIKDCYFISTRNSGGFCINTPIIKCEQLPNFLCLDHINDQLECYLDNNICKTNIFTNCNTITNQLVNYPTCQSISTQQNTCLYDHNTKLCKSIQYQYTDCTMAITDLECILVRNICYFVNNTCISNGTINQINRYGCIMKTDNAYRYDFVIQQCVLVSNQQSTCYHLNKQACLEYTNYIECQWINEQCSQIISLINCTDLNKLACLNVQSSNNQICQWNNNICQTIIPNINETCTSRISTNLSALNQCSSITDVPCIQKSNQLGCEQLSNNLNICGGYGLNRLACLNNTPLMKCYWHINGYCQEAQLDIIQCTDDVSEITCRNIQTLGQYCKWDNGCKYVPLGNKCSDASNLNHSLACLAIVTMACEYNNLTGICSQVPITPIECLDRYNKNSCELVQTRKCAWEQFKCVIPIYKIMECKTFLNKYLCLQDTELACQWTTTCVPYSSPQVFCKDLQKIPFINQKGCRTFSKDPCTLINEQCTPTISLDNLIEVYQILPYSDQYQSPQLTAQCNELYTLKDCIGSRLPNQSCIWDQNTCQFAYQFNQLKCTANLNQQACLLITTKNELCTWRDKCIYWNQQAIMSNVNINVCIQYSVSCIYYLDSCVTQNLDTLNCHSKGISSKTCMSLTRASCYVASNGECTDFLITNQKYCQDFVNVSPFVCATQKISSCVYSSETHQCLPFQRGQEFSLGISIKACLSNVDTYSIWINESCQILTFDIECDSDYYVNAIVCTKIISTIPCIYDQVQMKCVSNFNRNQLRCNTAGLNEAACALVADEPCIFQDNKCQSFNNITAACLTIQQVNGKACSSVINQQCYYDDLNHNCKSPLVLINKCTTLGLNQEGCQTNSLCGWNVSQQTCSCKDQVNVSCEYETATLCFRNSKCTWDIKKCVYKQCYHLEAQFCEGTLDGKLCYMSQDGCAGANKCEEVINADILCQNIYFKGKHCYQYNNNCISDNNYELICPQSDCLDQHCILQLGICRKKECQDYNQKVCNSFDGCVWINQQCQILNSCSDINNQINEQIDIQLLCNQLSVDGFKCNWQYYAFLDDTKICTNRPCEFYGSTNRFCQGNEMNNYACILNTNYVCIQCEQITDSCYCEQQENICYFKDNQCKSILCIDFIDKYDCNDSNRCYWSDYLKECSKLCTKITNQMDCDSRINECYYDPLSSICNEGTKLIPDLNVIIEIQTIYTQIILPILLILIIN